MGGFGWFYLQHRDSDGIYVLDSTSVYVGSLTAGTYAPHYPDLLYGTFTVPWTYGDTLYGSADMGVHNCYMWRYM